MRTARNSACTADGPSFEALEARLVLSDAYYELRSISDITGSEGPWGLAQGISGDGELLWSWWGSGLQSEYRHIATRDRVWTQAELPLLEDAEVRDLTSAGIVLARDVKGEDQGRAFTLNLYAPEERHYLDERAIEPPDGFDFAQLHPGAITESGDIFLHTVSGLGVGRGEVWLLREDGVELLWTAPPERRGDTFVQASSTGFAVGYGEIDGLARPVHWSRAMGLVEIEGLESVGAVGPNGIAAGKVRGVVAYWDAGVVRRTGLVDGWDGVGHSTYTPLSLDGEGGMLLNVFEYGETWSGDHRILFDGVHRVRFDDRIFGVRAWERYPFALGESGQLALDGFVDPLDPGIAVLGVPGRTVAFGVDGSSLLLYTKSLLGVRNSQPGREVTLSILPAGADWRVTTTYDWPGQSTDLEWATYIEPDTGRTILVLNDPTRETTPALARPVDGFPNHFFSFESRTSRHPTPHIRDGLTAFVTADQRAVIAGMNDLRHIVMSYEWRENGQWTWLQSNLTQTQLRPKGLQTPGFIGPLSSFSTSWGSMNIVGLDADGDVHAVWWSPGRGSQGWTTDNLSAATGAPKLVGRISAAATPWGAMQIFGTDERGHLIAIWWTPTSGGWHATDLTAHTGGFALDGSGLTVQGVPWIGMSIVGKSVEGAVVSYWWTQRDGWVSESISDRLGDAAPSIPGLVSYQTTRAGAQHIAGVSDQGHVMHIYWMPDGLGWRVQDLTGLAIG